MQLKNKSQAPISKFQTISKFPATKQSAGTASMMKRVRQSFDGGQYTIYKATKAYYMGICGLYISVLVLVIVISNIGIYLGLGIWDLEFMCSTDEQFMREALDEARLASANDEVPVGAIAVVNGEIVGRAHNIREKTANPLGHAEILLLEKLAHKSHDWRFEDVAIYVTCEPCIMCTGALLQSRVKRIVYGCRDPKAGACDSLYELTRDSRLNHQIETTGGVLGEECGKLLSAFFKAKRSKDQIPNTKSQTNSNIQNTNGRNKTS